MLIIRVSRFMNQFSPALRFFMVMSDEGVDQFRLYWDVTDEKELESLMEFVNKTNMIQATVGIERLDSANGFTKVRLTVSIDHCR